MPINPFALLGSSSDSDSDASDASGNSTTLLDALGEEPQSSVVVAEMVEKPHWSKPFRPWVTAHAAARWRRSSSARQDEPETAPECKLHHQDDVSQLLADDHGLVDELLLAAKTAVADFETERLLLLRFSKGLADAVRFSHLC